jgi:hypothetical protein
MKFGWPPVHFNEVQLTMILGIKVTNVTMGLHKFFKSRLLVDKIRLAEENPAATAKGQPIPEIYTTPRNFFSED